LHDLIEVYFKAVFVFDRVLFKMYFMLTHCIDN
jgi:hypothetical protein